MVGAALRYHQLHKLMRPISLAQTCSTAARPTLQRRSSKSNKSECFLPPPDFFRHCYSTDPSLLLLLSRAPHILVEALTGDFNGESADITRVALSGLDVYAHNLETVERLTPSVRDRRAKYRQSLEVLRQAKEVSGGRLVTKTSLMLGVGEQEEELLQTLKGSSFPGRPMCSQLLLVLTEAFIIARQISAPTMSTSSHLASTCGPRKST